MATTDPQADLEQMFIREFLQSRGHTLDSLSALSDIERTRLMAAASTYAADKLAEVEARARFVHEIQGD